MTGPGLERGPQPLPIRERLRAAEGKKSHGITGPMFAVELIRLSRLPGEQQGVELNGLYDDLARWEGRRNPHNDPRSEGEIRRFAGAHLDSAALLADAMVATRLETVTDLDRLLPAYEHLALFEAEGRIGPVTQLFREATGYEPSSPSSGMIGN